MGNGVSEAASSAWAWRHERPHARHQKRQKAIRQAPYREGDLTHGRVYTEDENLWDDYAYMIRQITRRRRSRRLYRHSPR
jgi:hypothetical protein